MFRLGYVFYALWLFWLIYWSASATGNKRAAIRVNPSWRLFGLISAVAAYILLRQFPAIFGRRLLQPTFTVEIVGLVLTAAGIAFSIWARRVLGRNWSATPMIKEDHELIQSGPYRFVRHPIYTGILVGIFGSCLAGGRLGDLCFFVILTVLFSLKLRVEESLMMQQFPDSYPAYRQRTKALVPFLF